MKKRIKILLFVSLFTFMSGFLSLTVKADTTPDGAEKGIDVSIYNGSVDFEKVKSQGYSFVMIRLGAGQDIVDECFEANYKAAKKAGLKVGIYYYSYALSVENAKSEAEKCLKILDGKHLDLPIAYDMENKQSLAKGKDLVTQMTKVFCEAIEEKGYQPMIYSYRNSLVEVFDLEQLSKYPVWIANYDVSYPNFPNPYFMWQYKSGSVSGANTTTGECDVNYMYKEFIPTTGVNISTENVHLEIGKSEQIEIGASIEPENATNKLVLWKSEDEKVAAVSPNGLISAKGNGTTNIVAYSVNGIEKKCKVKVTTPSTDMKIVNKSLELGKGESMKLETSLTPETSTDKVKVSSNSKVVTIKPDGTIVGKEEGKAEITAVTTSGIEKKVTITVGKRPFSIHNNKLFLRMNVGAQFQLKTTVSKGASCNQIHYSTRNKYKVDVDENGLLTANAKGYTLITAETYNGKKAWVIVKVE